jgi:hypothetical protein
VGCASWSVPEPRKYPRLKQRPYHSNYPSGMGFLDRSRAHELPALKAAHRIILSFTFTFTIMLITTSIVTPILYINNHNFINNHNYINNNINCCSNPLY